jgi:hypothetical protein
MALGPSALGTANSSAPEDRAIRLERSIDQWLEQQDPAGSVFHYPLAWWVHGTEGVLESLVPKYRALWRSVVLERADGCLKLVFEK